MERDRRVMIVLPFLYGWRHLANTVKYAVTAVATVVFSYLFCSVY